MKSVARLLADLVAWRWAPAAGLLAASMLFVLVVVGLVPSEIGEPVANTKLATRSLSTAPGAGTTLGADTSTDTTTASYANTEEAVPAPPPPAARIPAAEFGRRGFSPPLDRPEPPPTPVITPPPVIPPPNAQAARPASGIFSRLQGAFRPGSPIAAAAAAAAAASANAVNVVPPPPAEAPPAAEQPTPPNAEAPAARAAGAPPEGTPGTPPAEGTPGIPTRDTAGAAPPGGPPAIQ